MEEKEKKSPKDNIDQAISLWHDGNKQDARILIDEMRMDNPEFHSLTNEYVSKCPNLFVRNAVDVLKYFDCDSKFKSPIEFEKREQMQSILSYVEQERALGVLKLKDKHFEADTLHIPFYLRNCFENTIILNIPEDELDLMKMAGATEIEAEIELDKDQFCIVEKQKKNPFSKKYGQQLLEKVLIWGASNITPKRVALGVAVAGFAVSLFGSNEAMANARHVHDTFSHRKAVENIFDTVLRSIDFDEGVKVIENTFKEGMSGHGSGRVVIKVGDCKSIVSFIDGGSIQSVKLGISAKQFSSCEHAATELVKLLGSMISDQLGKK